MDNTDELQAAIQELADIARAYCEQLGEALRQAFAPAADSIRQAIEELAAAGTGPEIPRKKLPRPPRYAGPQNKGRSWTRQPPQMARSHCRKYRR